MKNLAAGIALITVLSAGPVAPGADWPQWHGANRDGKSPETGLLKQWPDGGPKLLWVADVDLGIGFSSLAVAGETIYVTGLVGSDGWLFAIDLNGKGKWKLKYGQEWSGQHKSARTTPTVDGNLLYLMSGQGKIVCVDIKTQQIKWSIDTFQKFGGRNITWGIAESPLLFDNTVICTPGGPDASVVALDKNTGKTIWTSRGLSDLSGYCSPILIKDDKKNLIATVTADNIVGIGASDGRVLWKVPYRNKWAAHPNSPVYRDGCVYITSGYSLGGVMLKLSADGTSVTKLWTERTLDSHHGGVVEVGGYIYGAGSSGSRICLDWKTGQVKYRTDRPAKGSVLLADGKLYCYDERGTVALVEPTPAAYNVVSSFRVTQGTAEHWAHPVIADGRLYIRHGSALMAYDIRGKDWKGSAAEAPKAAPEAAAKRRPAGTETSDDEQRAGTKLALAKSYLRLNMKAKAREELQSIIETYPDTPAAQDARRELANLTD